MPDPPSSPVSLRFIRFDPSRSILYHLIWPWTKKWRWDSFSSRVTGAVTGMALVRPMYRTAVQDLCENTWAVLAQWATKGDHSGSRDVYPAFPLLVPFIFLPLCLYLSPSFISVPIFLHFPCLLHVFLNIYSFNSLFSCLLFFSHLPLVPFAPSLSP